MVVAIAEYASNRLTLVCTSAAKLPTNIENPATTAINGSQPETS